MRARMILGAGLTALLTFPAALSADPIAKNVEVIPAAKVEADYRKPAAPAAPAARKPEIVNVVKPPSSAQRSVETSRTATSTRAYETATRSKPSKVAAVSPPAKKTRPAAPALKAYVDLSRQTMTVKVHGKTEHVWKISSGRRGYHTPNGTWRPKWMTRMHYSKKYDNAPMPYSVFFHGGYAIHATYATGRLGSPASHGCVRLSPANAKKFYQLVSRHGKSATRITVTGSTPSHKTYAKRKKTRRKTYSSNSGGYYQPANKPTSRKKKVRRYRKPKTNYAYSPSYSSGLFGGGGQKYTWPGDR